MTVLGIGIDLVEVARVDRLLTEHGERALRRVLSDDERAYCAGKAHPAQHVAARIAAKEAAYKALSGDGDIGYIPWADVEVARGGDGRPTLILHASAEAIAERLGVRRAHVSITHTNSHAAAIVVLMG